MNITGPVGDLIPSPIGLVPSRVLPSGVFKALNMLGLMSSGSYVRGTDNDYDPSSNAF
jgi:hypothetical protein